MFTFITTVLKTLVARATPAPVAVRAGAFEKLEGRDLFSGSAFVDANGGLNLIGTDADDHIVAIYDTAGTAALGDDKVHVRMGHMGHWHSGTWMAAGINHIVMRGLAGNDRLENNTPIRSIQYGEKGNDLLIGGSTYDHLDGGDDNDKLFGRDGHDRLLGGNGLDDLRGGNGNDYLDTGADFVFGEIAFGEGGTDTFKSRPGDFTDFVFGETIIP